jgi:hypothetical protein
MKKYIILLGMVLIVGANIFFFFYRMYHNDVKALEAFPAAYEKFDRAVSDYSTSVFAAKGAGAPAADDLERQADEALVDLNTKASARLSSLIKNDADLMRTTLEIADFSGKELEALKAYQGTAADKQADLDRFAKEFGDFTNKRQSAYARFRELAGL